MQPRLRPIHWLTLLVLIGLVWEGAPAARGGVFADAVPIYVNTFGEESDVNYDNWPDLWERVSGEAYHHYVDIAIVDREEADQGRCLQLDLKGGGVQVATPPIRVLPKFGYSLRFRVKTEGLVHSHLTVKVDLIDRHGKLLQRIDGPRLRDLDEWTAITSFPDFQAQHSDIDRAIIRFDVPRQRRGDLQGRIWIDQIEMIRKPSMTITTGRTCNVYDDFSQIKVKCSLSGIRDRNPEIRFQLLDATSRVIPGKTEDRLIDGRLIVEDRRWASDIVGGIGNRPDGYEGSTVWEPDIDDFGFYKVRVKMLSQDGQLADDQGGAHREISDQEITLVVLPALPPATGGEFGWTLPKADDPLQFELLEELMPRVGIQWVKLPVWFPADNPARGEALVKFAERVSGSGIQVVGIVDEPDLAGDEVAPSKTPGNVASFLQADPSVWQPLYDPMMTRLSLRLRYWQLGGDGDTGFYSYPDLAARIASIRKNLFRFGQDVKLGIGWRWPVGKDKDRWIPPDESPSWDFEQMSSHAPLTAQQIEECLATMPRNGTVRWSQVDPRIDAPEIPKELLGKVPAASLRHEYRIREFIRQMIAAKIGGADGIFISDPFTGPDGVMNVDGTPGELLLPWRTTAILLGGKTYLGSLRLPSGSPNHVFRGEDGEVVMVAWNDQPVTDRIYLGANVKQIDVWGKQHELDQKSGAVELKIGRLPTFFIDLHPEVTQFRMALEFAKDRVPSNFSIEHENSLKGRNHFSQGIVATATLYVPPMLGDVIEVGSRASDHWDITPRQMQFQVPPGEPFDVPFRFMLKDADYGLQPVRIDFRIEADREYQFSVWRDIRVGLQDLTISVSSRLDESGNLIVEQQMANFDSTPANFKCMLYAPPRRRKRTHVVMLGAEGNTKVYQYPDGEDLVGRVLTLRAEEIHGQRVLIYRFVAER